MTESRIGLIAACWGLSALAMLGVSSNSAHDDCNPRDFLMQDTASIQQSGDTELAFVLTSTQSEYENAKKSFGSSGAYDLFSATLSWDEAKDRARQIAQATKFDYKTSYASNYLIQSVSGKALDALSQCYEKDKERPGLALWLKSRDGDYFTCGACWVGADATAGIAKNDSELMVDGGKLISKPNVWLKAKTEEIVVKRNGNNDFYLNVKVGGWSRTKVIVKDPPIITWLKEAIVSKSMLVVQTADKNPGCGSDVKSDAIVPVHPGGYFVANTKTTNHSTNGPENYRETFEE